MLLKQKDFFNQNSSPYLKVVLNDNKYGIVNTYDESYIVLAKYDNVFIYGINTFVLCLNGKIGAVRIEPTENEISFNITQICDCEYDIIENFGHDLLFSNDRGTRYYNSFTKEIKDFVDVIIESPFLYCCDKTHQYIIYGDLGKIIYKKPYTQYSKSCFAFCGNTDKGPVFYDARYNTYIYPTDNGYMCYKNLFNHPIVLNRDNIVNIVEDEKGIGIIDSYGNDVLKNTYDNITVEIKITASKKNDKVEKIISSSKRIFDRDTISEIEDWL